MIQHYFAAVAADRDHAVGMRYAIPILIVMLLFAYRTAGAQGDRGTPLKRGIDLIQQGQFSAAIRTIKPVLDAGNLRGKQLGLAWSVLGFAYEQEGLFVAAHEALDRAIEVLGQDPNSVADYVTALSFLADLNQDEGQLDAAEHLRRRAIKIVEQRNSPGESAILYKDLAELMLAEHHVDKAKKYLETADSEASLAGPLDARTRADLAEADGWLALEEKHVPEAVAAYQRSLDFCKIAYGENHFLTGWGWTLLANALAEEGRTEEALVDMRRGLHEIEQTLGTRHPKYWAAELAYARVLDRVGSHAEAKHVKKSAEKAMNDFYQTQCARCVINASALQ
jgi:tetratricopeptide (TPR) repeat protein